jgi:hypothetical protein
MDGLEPDLHGMFKRIQQEARVRGESAPVPKAALLARGLSPDILNAAGLRPIDVVPDDVRALLSRPSEDDVPRGPTARSR